MLSPCNLCAIEPPALTIANLPPGWRSANPRMPNSSRIKRGGGNMKSKMAVWVSAAALAAALCVYMAATAHAAHGTYGGVNGIAAAADNNGCSNATLKGDYGYGVNGISITIPPVGS